MLAVLCWIWLLAPTPADVDKARELYRIGGEAYEQGRYVVAINAFEEARRLVDQPAIVFSLGQAARLQYFVDNKIANLRLAVDSYRDYLAMAPSGRRSNHAAHHVANLVPVLREAMMESAERRAARRAKEARLIVAAAVDGAKASVDGGDPLPIPATFVVPPGERIITVEAPEHRPAKQTAIAVAGAALPVQVSLVPLPGQVTVRSADADTARIDGQKISLAQLGKPIELTPGAHRLVLTAQGHRPFVQRFELDRRQALVIDAELPVTNQRVAAWSLLGAGGLSLITSGIFGALALDAQADAESLEGALGANGLSEAQLGRYGELESSRNDRAGLALGFGIAGATAVVTGVLLWIFDHEQPAAKSAL